MEIKLRYIYVITFGRVFWIPKGCLNLHGSPGFPAWLKFFTLPLTSAPSCRMLPVPGMMASTELDGTGAEDSPNPQGTPRTPSHLRCDLVMVASWWSIVIARFPSRTSNPFKSPCLLVQSPWFMRNVHFLLVKSLWLLAKSLFVDGYPYQSRLMRHCSRLLHRSLHLGWTQNWMVSYAIKFQEFYWQQKNGWSHEVQTSFTLANGFLPNWKTDVVIWNALGMGP